MIDLIGLPRYPLGHPGLKRVFRLETAKRIEDDGLAALMRQVHKRTPFKAGSCYTNTERVIANAKGNGWSGVLPFAGWLIINEGLPIHHAWAVHQGQVIDFGSARIPPEFLRALDEKWKKIGEERRRESVQKTEAIVDPVVAVESARDAWVKFEIDRRKELNAICRPYEEGDIIEHRAWGLPPEGHVYVGCPCTPEEARVIFNKWHAKYGERGEGPGELSVTQMLERGLENNARKTLEGIAEEIDGREHGE